MKELKCPLQKNDMNTGEQQDSRYPAVRFNEKGCLQACGGDALI